MAKKPVSVFERIAANVTAATTVPKTKKKAGGTKPPASRQRVFKPTDDAKVWAAEQTIQPWEAVAAATKPPSKKDKHIFPGTQYRGPVEPAYKAAERLRKQRVEWAENSLLPGSRGRKAREKLAQTMDPDRFRQVLLRPYAPPPSPPEPLLSQRRKEQLLGRSPIERAKGLFGLTTDLLGAGARGTAEQAGDVLGQYQSWLNFASRNIFSPEEQEANRQLLKEAMETGMAGGELATKGIEYTFASPSTRRQTTRHLQSMGVSPSTTRGAALVVHNFIRNVSQGVIGLGPAGVMAATRPKDLGTQVAQFYGTFYEPLLRGDLDAFRKNLAENPDMALDWLGGFGVVAGTGRRLTTAARAARAAEHVEATRVGAAAKALITGKEPIEIAPTVAPGVYRWGRKVRTARHRISGKETLTQRYIPKSAAGQVLSDLWDRLPRTEKMQARRHRKGIREQVEADREMLFGEVEGFRANAKRVDADPTASMAFDRMLIYGGDVARVTEQIRREIGVRQQAIQDLVDAGEQVTPARVDEVQRLERAAQYLEARPSDDFLSVVDQGRAIAGRTEEFLKEAGLLHPLTAERMLLHPVRFLEDVPTVDTPQRTHIQEILTEAVERAAPGLEDPAADPRVALSMRWLDANAVSYARRTGRTPEQFYDDLYRDAAVYEHEDMNDFFVDDDPEVFFQNNEEPPWTYTISPEKAKMHRRAHDALTSDDPAIRLPAEERARPKHEARRATTAQRLQRITDHLPDVGKRREYMRWYRNIWDEFGAYFGEDATAALRSFLISQAAMSPADGITSILKALEYKHLHGRWPPKGITSHKVQEIVYAWENIHMGEDPAGIAAKISDFFNSAEGRQTRSFLQDASITGPGVVDRWSVRSVGYVDWKSYTRLVEEGLDPPNPNQYVAWQKEIKEIEEDGKKRGGLTPEEDRRIAQLEGQAAELKAELDDFFDMSGAPDYWQYEWTSIRLDELRQMMNDQRYDGRDNWTADEVQALDWFATRNEWGEMGGGWEDTWARNTFSVIGEIVADLPQAMLHDLLDETVSKTGARTVSIHSAGQHVKVDVLSSPGWKEFPGGRRAPRYKGEQPSVRRAGGAAQVAKRIADESGRTAYTFYDAGAEGSGTRRFGVDVRGENVFEALSLTVKDLVDEGLLVLPTGDGGLRLVFADRAGGTLKGLGKAERDRLVEALDQIDGVEATPFATKMGVHEPKRRPNLALYRGDDARGVFARAASARRRGTGFRIARVVGEAAATRFVDGLGRNARAWSLSPRTVSEFTDEGYLGFLSDDGNAGAAVAPDGEIVGVFNSGSFPGAAAQALVEAMANGGYWLQAFDGYLPAYYANMGFREVARVRFSEDMASTMWRYQDGRPDLVFMAYAPHQPVRPTLRYVEYDEAVTRTRAAGQRALSERPIESILKELADRGDGQPHSLPDGQTLAQWKRTVAFTEGDPVILGGVRLTDDGAHLMVTPGSTLATIVHENAHVMFRGTLEWLMQGGDPRLDSLLKHAKIELKEPPIPIAPGRVLDEVLTNMGAKRNLYEEDRRVFDDPERGLGTMVYRYAIPQEDTFVPIEYAYRAISEEEYQGALKQGYFQSDQRMNLSMDEGTVAALQDPSYYLPGKLASDKPGTYRGRIIKIRLTDKWRRDTDGYMKTSERIPLDEIVQTSPLLEGQRETRLTAGGQEVPTMPEYRPVGEVPVLTREQQEFFARLVEAHAYIGGMPAPQLRVLMGEASTEMRNTYRAGIRQISRDPDFPGMDDRIIEALKDTDVSTILEDLTDVTYGVQRDAGAVFIPRVRPTSPSKIGNLVRKVSASVTRGAITPPRRPPTQPGISRGVRFEKGEYQYGPEVVAAYATQAFRWQLGRDLARDIFDSPLAEEITLDANGVPVLNEGYVPFVYENVPGVLRQIDEQLGMAAREEDLRVAREEAQGPDDYALTEAEPQELGEAIGAEVEAAMLYAMPDNLTGYHPADLADMLASGGVKQIPSWMRDDYLDAITGNTLLSAASKRAARDMGPVAKAGLGALGTFNAAARWSMIGKGAYVTTNTVGAFATATVHNPFWLGEIRKVEDFLSDWSPADLRMLDEMVGSGSFEISKVLEEEKAVLGRIGRAEREAYTKATHVISYPERRIRRLVAARELKASGIRSAADFRLFVEEAKVSREGRERFRQIARHAEDGVIRFRGMNETEKWIVRRAFFVYGWLRAAFRYTARFPIEHPVLAAAMNRLGNEGWEDLQEHLERQIGFRGGPVTKISERDGERIARMIDPTTVFPFATGMEITRAFGSMFLSPITGKTGGDTLSNMFSPGVEMGLAFAFGETPQGLTPAKLWESYGPDKGFQGVPALSWIMRINDPKLSETVTYGARTRRDVVGAFFFGQLWPRDMKLDAAQDAYLRRQPIQVSAPIRVQQDLDKLMDLYSQAANQNGAGESADYTLAAQAHAAYDLTTRLKEHAWDDANLNNDQRDIQRSIVRAKVLRRFYPGAYETIRDQGYVDEDKSGAITALDAEIVDDEYKAWVSDSWSDMRSYIRDTLGEKVLGG